MDYLLSFSIGAILGDIFFHLIPESLDSHLDELKVPTEIAQRKVGLAIVAGLFMFIIVEMILERWSNQENPDRPVPTAQMVRSEDLSFINDDKHLTNTPEMSSKVLENNNNNTAHCDECSHHTGSPNVVIADCLVGNDQIKTAEQTIKNRKQKTKALDCSNDNTKPPTSHVRTTESSGLKLTATNFISGKVIDPAGYLSLIANGIDNFTHGLAIGASFLVGPKVGLLTTFVIFIHEIPHEICDYAILVNSGFSRWDAVKAQSSVSLFGIMGTATALYFKSIDTLNAKTIWILPFSAGGFLYIALVNLLPEILSRRTNLRDSMEQIGCVILGITFMGTVALS